MTDRPPSPLLEKLVVVRNGGPQQTVVTELRRCGIGASELDDGIEIRPGSPRPAAIETYHDHRMAMAFALLGLRSPGIAICDPSCVSKTFPGYWRMLDDLRSTCR